MKSEQFCILMSQQGHLAVVTDKTLLKCIQKCFNCESEVVKALAQLGKLAPAKLCNDLMDWNVEQGLLLYHRIGLSMDPAHFAD